MTTTAITTTPFLHSSAELLTGEPASYADWELKEFTGSWEDLEVDAYLKDGATFRRRRYGQFRLDGDRIVPVATGAFEQSTEVNAVFGGLQRHFEPIRDHVAASPVLQSIVSTFLSVLPGPLDTATAGIGVHQIRIIARRDEAWPPAPEGIHEDGHHYVAQVLINRQNVVGGESQLYDRERAPLFRTTLLEPFESIVIDDRRVFHGVSAVAPAEDVSVGVRDMMLIDFFPLGD
ncbi:2OG-Fe dioxygenase family protein [Streptomyces sp. NPDC057287]|uniref:2OG-Fe dioxygenase family protein n=1 Tax=Streptomyces sp. NPDC057287 TaxID=3346086 RepID=UPI003635F39D